MKWIILVTIATLTSAFKEIQDGAKIVPEYTVDKDTYSIPLRSALKSQQAALLENSAGAGDKAFDHDEFNLISLMKTVEVPPSEDAKHYYAESRQLHSSSNNRFNRNKRSPQGLKFDGQDSKGSSSEGSGGKQQHPKSINDQLPRGPAGGNFNFDGQKGNKGGSSSSGSGDDNKRLFPFMNGYGPGYGFGGNYGGGHPYYPTAGFQGGYPGGGGFYGGGYPGGGYPGFGGGTGVSSASASASSTGGNHVGGFGGPGFGGGGLYGNGFYPGGGYYGAGYPTTYPILAGGGFPGAGLGGFGGFGGFRDESGKGGAAAGGPSKVTAGAVSSGGKVAGGVSFE